MDNSRQECTECQMLKDKLEKVQTEQSALAERLNKMENYFSKEISQGCNLVKEALDQVKHKDKISISQFNEHVIKLAREHFIHLDSTKISVIMNTLEWTFDSTKTYYVLIAKNKLIKMVQANRCTPDEATHFYVPEETYFKLSNEEQAQFWIYYCKIVSLGQRVPFCEIIAQTVQLTLDINLSVEKKSKQLINSFDQCAQRVIQEIQKVLYYHFNPTTHNSHLIACYLRPPDNEALASTKDEVHLNGRIVFPYARMDKKYVTKLTNEVNTILHYAGHPEYIVPGTEKFILYGSSNMKLIDIYGWLTDNEKITYELSEVFNVNLHENASNEFLDQNLLYTLPMFFSNGYYNQSLIPKEESFENKITVKEESLWDKAINNALASQNNTSIAKAFKELFPNNFIWSNDGWYYYNQHHWKQDENGCRIRIYFDKEFLSRLDNMRIESLQRKAQSHDNEYKNRFQKQITQIDRLIKKLSNDQVIKNICKAAQTLYHHPNFEQIKDSDSHLIATQNGVIDLRENYINFRSGKPQDYLTKVACAYPQNYTWRHKAVKQIMDYLNNVFTNENLLKYFLRVCSSLLTGNKIILVLSDKNNDGTTNIVKLLRKAFGDYAHPYQKELLMHSSNTKTGSISLNHADKRRIAFFSGFNKYDKLKHETLEFLLQNNCTPILTDKIHLAPNFPDELCSYFRVIEFTSTVKDLSDNELISMAPAFLWILVQKYPEYIEHGLNDPPEVLQAPRKLQSHEQLLYSIYT